MSRRAGWSRSPAGHRGQTTPIRNRRPMVRIRDSFSKPRSVSGGSDMPTDDVVDEVADDGQQAGVGRRHDGGENYAASMRPGGAYRKGRCGSAAAGPISGSAAGYRTRANIPRIAPMNAIAGYSNTPGEEPGPLGGWRPFARGVYALEEGHRDETRIGTIVTIQVTNCSAETLVRGKVFGGQSLTESFESSDCDESEGNPETDQTDKKDDHTGWCRCRSPPAARRGR